LTSAPGVPKRTEDYNMGWLAVMSGQLRRPVVVRQDSEEVAAL